MHDLAGSALQLLAVSAATGGEMTYSPPGAGEWVTVIIGYLAFGYLLGSVPFGLLLTKAAGLGDIRKVGSGNIGATNVLRTGNKGLALATLLLDGIKGLAAVLIAGRIGARYGHAIDAELLAGLGAFLGHLFPVWLGFKGGKGVATYIGVLFAVAWPAAIVCCGTWLAVAFLMRYSSLAALIAATVTPIYLIASGDHPAALLFFVLTALLTWKHRGNIERLRAGTEPKIGAKG